MITPLPGYVLIEAVEKELKTASGMVLPETSQDRPIKGKVLAIGEGEFRYKMYPSTGSVDAYQVIKTPFEVGQIVIFQKWQGQDVTDESKELKLIKFENLMGVVE